MICSTSTPHSLPVFILFLTYTELAGSAYSTALERMKSQAMSIGADAIIGVHFVSATVTVQGAIEATVYGTAVNVKKVEEETSNL